MSLAIRRIVVIGIIVGSVLVLWQIKHRSVDPALDSSDSVNVGKQPLAAGVSMRPIPVASNNGGAPSGIPVDSPTAVGPSTGAGPQGGCAVGYGRGLQCLPPLPPNQEQHVRLGHSPSPWGCSELRTLFPKGISVNEGTSRDPLRLDTNNDGIACGAGDRNG